MGAHRIDKGTQLRKCTGTETTLKFPNQEKMATLPSAGTSQLGCICVQQGAVSTVGTLQWLHE